jgi:uncharacterized protein (TIGR01777 family)
MNKEGNTVLLIDGAKPNRGETAMRVFVTGGTGLIGTHLLRRLRERGDNVVLLSRRPAAARERVAPEDKVIEGDPMKPGPWMDAVADCDAVIHLAGENIFGQRWSTDFKTLLRDSRVQSTELVVQALAKNPRAASGNAKVLVNASAIGYYGPRGDEEIAEDAAAGNDLLARVCVDWEQAARKAEALGVRVVVVRVGVVLDKAGGALAALLTPFKLFVGGPVGSGKQWMSWIHYEDIVGLILLSLDHVNAHGPLNGTAPQPVTNKEFSKALGRALHRPSFLPTPVFALKLMLGEVADVVATGQRVAPKQALALGYQFKFPSIDAALGDILK